MSEENRRKRGTLTSEPAKRELDRLARSASDIVNRLRVSIDENIARYAADEERNSTRDTRTTRK